MGATRQLWRPGEEPGRLLAYTDAEHAALAAELTARNARSGLVVRGPGALDAVRALPEDHRRQPVVVDVAAWTRRVATATEPSELTADGLFRETLDGWAGTVARYGVCAVLTPSRFVRSGDWAALRALVTFGATATRPDVVTLVPTDGEMLGREYRSAFLRVLDEHAGERPLAFAFAGRSAPIASLDRAAGLRELTAARPGSLVVATDVLAGTDCAARDVSAAIGVTGSLRRPARPGDRGGGFANGFAPGLFLRLLWELRSPSTYADWFANSASPTCARCGGRALDGLTAEPADKLAIIAHNVHAWLEILDELSGRNALAAQAWLDNERRRALEAHRALRPGSGTFEADRLLRALCELDDLQQRRTTVTGEWI